MLETSCARSCAALIALSLCSTVAAPQTVLVVDDQPGPGVQYTSLTQALLAASDGDVVLVKPGDHEAETIPGSGAAKLFKIDGKSVDVVADVGGPVRLRNGKLTITGLGANQSVSLVGLEFTDTGLISLDNDGLVLVRDCRFPGFKATIFPEKPLRTIAVIDTAAFLFADSWLEGYTSSTAFGVFPGLGLSVSNSNIYLDEATILGGWGAWEAKAAAAVVVNGGSFFASNSLLVGGQAAGPKPSSGICGDGGDGLVLLGGATAETSGGMLVGGPSGYGCAPGNGQPGVPVDDSGGTYTVALGPVSGIEVTSPVREGHTAVLIAKGPVFSQAFLFVSSGIAVNPLAGIPGTLFVDPANLLVVPLGQITGPGSESFSFILGQLGPGAQALPLSLQMAFVGYGGSLGVSGLARLVVLDSAF